MNEEKEIASPIQESVDTKASIHDIDIIEPESEIIDTQNLTAILQNELQETKDRLLRLQADFENFRRRTTKEKLELTAVITQSILKDILPMLDNFERAMIAENKNSEAFYKGMEMIFSQFQEILASNGLESIETEGKVFDPNYHQAVLRVENPEVPEGTIVAELQKGYQVKGVVIRPSMVQVAGN